MAVSVFGMIVAGRLVSTDFQVVDETHFIINVPEADNIRHIIVFLTGSQPLPDNTAAGGENTSKNNICLILFFIHCLL